MNLISRIIYHLSPKSIQHKIRLMDIGYQLMTSKNSYLVNIRYVDSMVDPHFYNSFNAPLPWMNFPLIEFLEEKLNKQQTLFEYGSGSSTLFFSEHVFSVSSVEHNRAWFEKLNPLLLKNPNATYQYHELNQNYPEAIRTFGVDKKYDIIIIDGRKRVACTKVAFDFLSSKGVIILDDSGRERYKEVFVFFAEKGFNQLTFQGMKHGKFKKNQGTIFYRSGDNCFNI